MVSSLQLLLPENKVGVVDNGTYLNVSVYSNHLEELLGWCVGRGSKLAQKVTVPMWIKGKREYKIECLRGLIETDGSIYNDRNYKMIMFTSANPDLAKEFYEMLRSLSFKPYLYKIKRKSEANKKNIYHVRLSKNVSEFLDLVKPEKS